MPVDKLVIVNDNATVIASGMWDTKGGNTSQAADAAVVAVLWDGENPNASANLVCTALDQFSSVREQVAILWHLSGGRTMVKHVLGGLNCPTWSARSLFFHRNDEIGTAVKGLADSNGGRCVERFQKLFALLCRASSRALEQGNEGLGQRHDIAAKALRENGVAAVVGTPLCRLRHRLAESLGEVLLCLRSWQEDEHSPAIKGIAGRGGRIWAEVEAILLGERECQWLKKIGLPPVARCAADEQVARAQLDCLLGDAAVKTLKDLLEALDKKGAVSEVRQGILITQTDPLQPLFDWQVRLDRYLGSLQGQERLPRRN